jgi:membrane associated rhomboid family serine protease
MMFQSERIGIEPGVKWLLVATAGIFAVQVLVPPVARPIENLGALVPSAVVLRGQLWRLVSYLFLHGSFMHILFNMLILWMMGIELERYWGTARFVTFYFLGGIGSGLFSLINIFSWNVPIIGASGALFAILTLYAYYFPGRTVLLFFFIPLPVRTAVVLLGLISLFFAFSSAGGLAHITHLGGIVVGLLYIRFYPTAHARFLHFKGLIAEHSQRTKRRREQAGQRYFDTVIDPILSKISAQGIDSLSAAERRELNRASKTHSDGIRKGKSVPFDFLKK